MCACGYLDTLVLPGCVPDVLCGWLQAGAPLDYTGNVKEPSGDVRRLSSISTDLAEGFWRASFCLGGRAELWPLPCHMDTLCFQILGEAR